jgi:hypothetical protein
MEWTARIGDKDYIARSDEELLQWYREGRVKPDSLVFHPVLSRWMRAAELEELRTAAHVPNAFATTSSSSGMSAKASFIVVGIGIAIVTVLVLISSVMQRAAVRQRVADEAAKVSERERIRAENLSSARTNVARLDPQRQPDDYARQCETIEHLDIASMSADVLTKCAAAHLEIAKRNLANGDLANARRVFGIARVTERGDGPEFVRFDDQLTRREATARKNAEAEQKVKQAKDAKERAALEATLREAYGAGLRKRFLDRNLDIKVVVTGSKKDRITLKFVLFNDVWSHRMQEDGLLQEMKDLGFRKVTMTDDYDYTVYWDFK